VLDVTRISRIRTNNTNRELYSRHSHAFVDSHYIRMHIKPLGDRVLIEPLHEERKKGRIILPDTVEKERSEKGKVVAVGPGNTDDKGKHVPMTIKKGDVVLFTKYGPNEIKITDSKGEEKEYLIAKLEDILAIIE